MYPMYGIISRTTVTDANVRIHPYASLMTEMVVCVDEAAFGTFEVGSCEGGGDAAESKGLGIGVEGGGVHEYWVV